MSIVLPVALITGMGLAFGFLLSLADKFFAVPVDERAAKIREALPGANCGACGFAGCDEYAAKLAQGEAKTNACIPGGQQAIDAISAILGVAAEASQEVRALVACGGTDENSQYCMEYEGPKSCKACNMFFQGRKSCSNGCLGYGDCVEACKFNALVVKNGLAVVDPAACTGCGACAKECPNHIIALIPKKSKYVVACSSHDKGAIVRKTCSAGCIGCGICQKNCPSEAITVTDNLAVIDQAKCTGCGICAEKCPTKCIHAI